MQPIQALQVLSENTKQIFQIYVNKQRSNLRSHISNKRTSGNKVTILKVTISYNVINVIAKGIVVANDRTILVERGGHLKFTDNWARNILDEVQRSEKKWCSKWL